MAKNSPQTHSFELPSKGQRLEQRMEQIVTRAAALNGLAARIKKVSESVSTLTFPVVVELEEAFELYLAEKKENGIKSATTVARIAWPEFHAAATNQDEDLRHAAKLLHHVVGELLAAL